MFIHLHWHSTFSFLESIGKPRAILDKAKELEMNAIAITDYNWMYGIIKFYQMAKEENIKPIIWVELGFVLDISSTFNSNQIWNIVLLAKNKQWYQNLMELISFANQDGIKWKPKIDINILSKYWQWLIALFGWIESWIGKMITFDENESKLQEIIQMIQQAVGEKNVYLEITAQDYSKMPELKKINNQILNISQSLKIPCVINNNFFYPNIDDKQARQVALAIKDGKKMYDEDRRKPKWDYHIMSEEEIREIMMKNDFDKKLIDEFIENNNKVANDIDTQIDLHQTLFPNYDSPEDIIEIYEQIKDDLVQD